MVENLLNEQVISDYDLVNLISEDLAVFYRKAVTQSVTECYPESLVNYRCALSIIVSLVSKALGVKGASRSIDLKLKIDTLTDSGQINFMFSNLMHDIRSAGNKGTHSEEFADEDFKFLCKKTHNNFFKLLKELFSKLNPGVPFPSYEFKLEEELNIVKLSHKALFEDDSESQFLVAKKLYSNVQRKLISSRSGHSNKRTIIELTNGEKEIRYHDTGSAKDTSIAFQLFDACRADIPEAEYEYGKLLLIDGNWLSDISTEYSEKFTCADHGITYIHGAANDGVTEALSLFGSIKLHGLYGKEIDTEWALELLGNAANDNDSSAIFELANYYFNDKQNDTSLKYFKLAAQFGSPKAQYLLAKHYLDGVFITADDDEIDQLINDASTAGVKEARLFKARRIATSSGDKFNQEALNIYEQYADEHPTTPEGILECAQYFIKHDKQSTRTIQYLTSAAYQAKEESKNKLAAFIGFIIGNSQTLISDDHKMTVKYPPEALMNIEQVNISKLMSPVKASPITLQRKLVSVPSDIGRNDPCFCGSGEKYKKCCLH